MKLTLLSTVVAPKFSGGMLALTPVKITADLLSQVSRNLCGHPVTSEVLQKIFPALPEQKKAFWDGSTRGLAIRPKGGVRASTQDGDTKVTLDDLEAVLVDWTPAIPWKEEAPRLPCAGEFFNCPAVSH
ncbi:MAG: hypothetical protein DRI57_09165 [Deltaproteobacteria bacterium]|nr:MAG: hypothetical protein DRI57_09165 [Deltaproteobacteria bacterium]